MSKAMPNRKKCATCGQIMSLAFIHGRPCYKHPSPVGKAACDARKVAAEMAHEARVWKAHRED